MKKLTHLQLALGVFVACALSARADTIMNGFDSGQDYVVDGVVGQTLWDGVYLGAGDIPGNGGGGGVTAVASEASPFAGFMSIQSSGTDWSGGDNDGFFLYKVVQGDFDVSVKNEPFFLNGDPGFDNRNYHFAGLMVRAYNPDNSGAGYSTTDTNNPTAENSLRLWRFQEFGIDGQIRVSTNGANQELNFPGDNGDTNSSRYYRITRTGNDFAFYVKTNEADAWAPVTNNLPTGVLTRGDWDGVALQVGLAQAAFSTATRDVIFDDFELSGTNVTLPTLPTPTVPSSLARTGSDPSGSFTLSWTPGTPGNGSLVVMTQGKAFQHNPVNGLTYNASAMFGDPDALIGGDGEYVVYSGTGSSVTVSNLGASLISYSVAVYEYSGSGDSTVYNTASPETNSFDGPGKITGVEMVVPTTDIPVDGAVQLRLIGSFSTGEVSDQTGNATWSSDAPTIADVGADTGTVNGITPGSASISVSFSSFNLSTNITVNAFAGFADDFTAVHDYVADALPGTPYNGLYLNFGDVPGSIAGGDGDGSTLTMDSQIFTTNGLYVSSVQSTWNDTANDGPFLFKIVPGSLNSLSGDFSAALHIESMNVLNGVVAGLMARLYDPANGGPSPVLEHHVEFWKVQNGTTSVRRTQDQPGNNTTTFATGTAVNWLLMTRVDSTNFYFFEKEEATNALWIFVTNVVLEAAAGDAPMQVGAAQQSTTGVNGLTTFDNFSLSAEGIVSATAPPPGASDFVMNLNSNNLTMELSWVAADAGGNPVRSIAVMREGGPISAQPFTGVPLAGSSTFGQGTDLGGGNYVVFVADDPPASTNNSVVVFGLTPGESYYATIYTFAGTDADTSFNTLQAPSTNGVDGVLEDIAGSLPGGIPEGGIGKLQVEGIYTGGIRKPLTTGVTVLSGDTNVIKISGGVLTGIANGMAPVTSSFAGFTNVASVEVRPPTFVDDFNVSRDYLTAGVAGSGYDGLYNPTASTNPIPGSPYVPVAGSGTVVADANISSNGVLTITAAGDGWENDASGGFFLFKYVPGDFQISTRIDNYEIAGFNMPGLLARAYGVDTDSGLPGAPFGTVVPNAGGTNTLGEYFVSLCRFDEFGIGTYARRNIDSAVSQNTQPDIDTSITNNIGTNYWILIARSKGTEFDFYKRSSPTDPWVQVPNKTHYSIPQFAGQPMQVGIMGEPWNGTGGLSSTYRTAALDNFMLDVAPVGLQIAGAGGSVYLTYPMGFGYSLESTVGLNPADWQPVAGTPVATNGVVVTISVPTANDSSFFRLVQ